MTGVEILGWLAALVGTSLGLPQLVRLVRTRSTAGLSLLAWQAILTLNLIWFVHGVKIGAANMSLPNLLALATTVPVLVLMSRDRGRPLARVLWPSLLGAALLITIDLLTTGGVFGMFSLVPAALANLGQCAEVIRARDVTGLSPVFLVLGLVNQLLWLSWAIGISEPSSIISSVAITVIVSFTLVWYTLRRLGLRALWPSSTASVGDLVAEAELAADDPAGSTAVS